MRDDIDWDLILKILTKTETSKEWYLYKKCLKEDPKNKIIVDVLKQYINDETEISESKIDFEVLQKRLQFSSPTNGNRKRKVYYNIAA